MLLTSDSQSSRQIPWLTNHSYVNDYKSAPNAKKYSDKRRDSKFITAYFKNQGGMKLIKNWATEDGVHDGIQANIAQLVVTCTNCL